MQVVGTQIRITGKSFDLKCSKNYIYDSVLNR